MLGPVRRTICARSRVELGVVGHEGVAARLLDHRMAPLADDDRRAGRRHPRPHVAVARRHLGEGGEGVERRPRAAASAVQPGGRGRDRRQQLAEVLLLQRDLPLLGGEDLLLQLLDLRRDVALGVDQVCLRM